ncbi:hypothetical protein GCM10009612_14630 [Streptomyces beijiangensis]
MHPRSAYRLRCVTDGPLPADILHRARQGAGCRLEEARMGRKKKKPSRQKMVILLIQIAIAVWNHF